MFGWHERTIERLELAMPSSSVRIVSFPSKIGIVYIIDLLMFKMTHHCKKNSLIPGFSHPQFYDCSFDNYDI